MRTKAVADNTGDHEVLHLRDWLCFLSCQMCAAVAISARTELRGGTSPISQPKLDSLDIMKRVPGPGFNLLSIIDKVDLECR